MSLAETPIALDTSFRASSSITRGIFLKFTNCIVYVDCLGMGSQIFMQYREFMDGTYLVG